MFKDRAPVSSFLPVSSFIFVHNKATPAAFSRLRALSHHPSRSVPSCRGPFPPPVASRPSLNLHRRPPRRHQRQQMKARRRPFFLVILCRRRTDSLMSAFIPCVLGIKCDISLHANPPPMSLASPFVSPCIFLYEISVLIGEIVVYGQALEFQEIMEGVLCPDLGQEIIEMA